MIPVSHLSKCLEVVVHVDVCVLVLHNLPKHLNFYSLHTEVDYIAKPKSQNWKRGNTRYIIVSIMDHHKLPVLVDDDNENEVDDDDGRLHADDAIDEED